MVLDITVDHCATLSQLSIKFFVLSQSIHYPLLSVPWNVNSITYSMFCHVMNMSFELRGFDGPRVIEL